MIRKYIKVPIFPVGFWFFADCSVEEVKKALKIEAEFPAWRGGTFKIEKNDNTTFVLWLLDKNTAKLVHELDHLVFYFAEYIGIEYVSGAMEWFAYMKDYLFSICEAMLYRKTNKNPVKRK